MTNQPPSKNAVGKIVGFHKSGLIIVRLQNGDELLCRGAKMLHRRLGFYTIPVGRRARVRLRPGITNRKPLILEVLDG
jgi:hypothetical protein